MSTFVISDADIAEAARLIASGYRPGSNKYRLLSRIDREDWRECMADFQTGGFSGDKAKNRADGMRWVTGLGDGAADFYRSVISKDTITVGPEVYAAVKRALNKSGASHGWGQCNDYLPIVERGDESVAELLA